MTNNKPFHVFDRALISHTPPKKESAKHKKVSTLAPVFPSCYQNSSKSITELPEGSRKKGYLSFQSIVRFQTFQAQAS